MTDLKNEENLQDMILTSALFVLLFGDSQCLPCAALRRKMDL